MNRPTDGFLPRAVRESTNPRASAFDILATPSGDVRGLSYERRCELLEQVLANVGPPIQPVMTTRDPDEAQLWHDLLPAANGTEGLVIKRLSQIGRRGHRLHRAPGPPRRRGPSAQRPNQPVPHRTAQDHAASAARPSAAGPCRDPPGTERRNPVHAGASRPGRRSRRGHHAPRRHPARGAAAGGCLTWGNVGSADRIRRLQRLCSCACHPGVATGARGASASLLVRTRPWSCRRSLSTRPASGGFACTREMPPSDATVLRLLEWWHGCDDASHSR